MNNWTNQIDKNTVAFQQHFGVLKDEELNWKPTPETWSIAQNIDHLIVINQTYFPVFTELKYGIYKPPFIARFGFIVSYLGKLILNSVQPDRSKKLKTFPIWEPAQSRISEHILEKFSRHQAELKRQIEALEGFLDSGTVISSPANRVIVYKLETAFDIIVTHEQRHLEQAKEVLELLKTKN